MKKLLSILLALCLLLMGCQTAAPEETEQTITYDWVAGECLISQQRTGIDRQGISATSNFECTAEGVYFIYQSRYIGRGISWLLYADSESDTIIKLCGRADCPHSDSDCNAYIPGGYLIRHYDGHLYASTGSGSAQKLVRMDMDGTNRITVMNAAQVAAENGYTGASMSALGDGIYTFVLTKLNADGVTIGDCFYFNLDGSMEEPEKIEAGAPTFNENGFCLFYTNAQNGGAYGGYQNWDPKTNTVTYLTDHSGYPGYYGKEEAYYFRDGIVWRLNYAETQETVLFETGLDGNYRLCCFPDCLIIASQDSAETADRNLYIYNWSFELVDTVKLDYPSSVSADSAIAGETAERLILTDQYSGLPRYYIEKSELGTGNATIHEYSLPDFSEEVQFIEEILADEEWLDGN